MWLEKHTFSQMVHSQHCLKSWRATSSNGTIHETTDTSNWTMIRLIPIICLLKLRKRRHNHYDMRKQVSCWSFLLFIDYGTHWSEWRECWGNYLVWEKLIPQNLNNFGSWTVQQNYRFATSNLPHRIRMRSHHLLRNTALPYPFSPQK